MVVNMCGGGGGSDNSAEIARQEEAARQARVDQGVEVITNAFDGTLSGINPFTGEVEQGQNYYDASGGQLTLNQRDVYGAAPNVSNINSFSGGFGTPISTRQVIGQEDYWSNALGEDIGLYDGSRELFSDTIRSGGFDDDFFQGYQDDYLGYYNPQLDDQYSDAQEQLTLNLARSGNLTSSSGVNQLQDLDEFYGTQKQSITNRALDAAQQLRGDVDNRKSQLYADNRAAADPGAAASAAASAAAALQPTAPTSPLASVFGDFFNNVGNVSAIQNNQGFSGSQGVQNYGGSSGGSVNIVR